jgi:hypothetical protein
MPRLRSAPMANAIRRPSGDQAGEATSARNRASRRCKRPSARAIHSSRTGLPVRRPRAGRRVNTIRRPSGDQAGERSSAPPVVSFRARPPTAGIRQRSPFARPARRTKAICPREDHAGASSSAEPRVSCRGR